MLLNIPTYCLLRALEKSQQFHHTPFQSSKQRTKGEKEQNTAKNNVAHTRTHFVHKHTYITMHGQAPPSTTCAKIYDDTVQ